MWCGFVWRGGGDVSFILRDEGDVSLFQGVKWGRVNIFTPEMEWFHLATALVNIVFYFFCCFCEAMIHSTVWWAKNEQSLSFT